MLREPAHQPGRLDSAAAASLHWPGSASGTPAWVPGSSNTSQQAGAALELAVVAAIADDGVAAGLAAAGADPTLQRDTEAWANHRAVPELPPICSRCW
jgi:hypothetical protein